MSAFANDVRFLQGQHGGGYKVQEIALEELDARLQFLVLRLSTARRVFRIRSG